MSLAANPDIMYRLLIQSVVDYAIYLLTPEGIVANWNPGAQRAKGYHAEEIVGQHYSVFYTDAERAAGLPTFNLEQARSTGRFEETGARLRKDGTAFHAHVVIEAVYDDAGQLVGFAKVTRDISERHRQELELLQAKELAEQYSQEMAKLSQFLDSVIANIPASVIVQDLESQRILLANQQAERLFGGPQRSMIGQLPKECLAPAGGGYLGQ
ncbi:PAS domain-containing protein, partial [Pseudomonas monteilii]|uniref:PAS domain-containing protein n=1 Tax=Pseudomonas monteilii TaxID=76759 RepID=UPI00211E1645